MLQRVVNPQTGRVDAKALAAFNRENTEILNRFDNLKKSIADAETAQNTLERLVASNIQGRKVVAQKAAFARVAGIEPRDIAGVEQTVRSLLTSRTPIKDYNEMARLAKNSGPDAVAGLRQATFDHLAQLATTGDLTSGRKMRLLLEGGLLDAMKKNGTINDVQTKNVMEVVEALEKMERNLSTRTAIGEVLHSVSGLEDLFIRIFGANAGGAGAIGQTTGAPFVAAQAGSRFARQLSEKVPMAKTRDIIANALENPKMMAALLEKGGTAAGRRSAERQVNAWLFQTAINEGIEGEIPPSNLGSAERGTRELQPRAPQTKALGRRREVRVPRVQAAPPIRIEGNEIPRVGGIGVQLQGGNQRPRPFLDRVLQ
jgi:hypothetical protein